MKKISLIKPFLLLSFMTISLSLAACNTPANNTPTQPEQETKYTVWINRSTYKDFKNAFKRPLDDGKYLYVEYPAENWQKVLNEITDKRSGWQQRSWTEQQIKDWFLDHGFDQQTTTERATWLIKEVEHGLIISRTDTTMYYLIK